MAFDGSGWLPPGIEEEKAFNEKYLLERYIGKGGAGAVWCARHRALDARVAIKFLLPSAEPTKAMARFTDEARRAKRITNAHCVRIEEFAILEKGGVPYLVMEYLEGDDLERTLHETANRQLPIGDAIDFILQAGEAVAESHSLGIVHRDLKPSNLFCVHGADGLPVIKVLDFGISKGANAPERITMGGQIFGSPPYMSPEQYESTGDVDLRTDIWSIGVILYEFLTGQQPFVGTDPFTLRQRIAQAVPKPMAELRRDLPRGLEPVVLRCLEKDRNRRYSNLAELAKALRPCAPSRSQASIACIVRTLEMPGCTTNSLALPVHEPMASESSTVDGVAASKRRPRHWGRTLPALLGAIGLAGGIIAARLVVHRPQSESVTPAPSAVPVQAIKETPPSKAEVPSEPPTSDAPAPPPPAPIARIHARTEHVMRPAQTAPSHPPSAPPATGNAMTVEAPIPTNPAPSTVPSPVAPPIAPATPPFIIAPVEERHSPPVAKER